MMAKKKAGLPDLLGDSLSNNKDVKTEKQELAKIESRRKVTLHLSEDAIDALEDLKYNARKLATTEKMQITKSLLVDQAIIRAFNELLAKKEKSAVFKELWK